MPTVADLCRDLAAEEDALDALLSGLAEPEWERPTPAAGWDVRDSLSHLCFFEEAALLAVVDPVAFADHRSRLIADLSAAVGGAGATPDVALGRSIRDPELLLDRWRQACHAYVEAVTAADAAALEAGDRLRIPWYGPEMSAASFTTARLLETWAHGTDVRDALGRPLEFSERLRHICHIGFAARAYSFAAHAVIDPGSPVRLEATAPDGGVWGWGPEDAADRITGTAVDVALVFAQRRHWSRTSVRAAGPVAELWLSIAQAFAGPPTVTAPER